MSAYDLTPKYRKKLEDAVISWNLGEEHDMLDLLYKLYDEAFAEGCLYAKDRVVEFLSAEGSGMNEQRR